MQIPKLRKTYKIEWGWVETDQFQIQQELKNRSGYTKSWKTLDVQWENNFVRQKFKWWKQKTIYHSGPLMITWKMNTIYHGRQTELPDEVLEDGRSMALVSLP